MAFDPTCIHADGSSNSAVESVSEYFVEMKYLGPLEWWGDGAEMRVTVAVMQSTREVNRYPVVRLATPPDRQVLKAVP